MERSMSDIVREWEEQGQDSQWVMESDPDVQEAINIIREREQNNAQTCDTCGEDIDPEFIVDDYKAFGIFFCSEKCMREFENIGK